MRVSIFYIFSTLACIFGLLAITRRNPVHSALMLVLSLLSLAAVYLSLGALFIAMAQIFVYAGGIMVLFLFVIMLVGTRAEVIGVRGRAGYAGGLMVALAVLVVLLWKLPYLGGMVRIIEVGPRELAAVLIGTQSVLGEHAFAFELASVLVLVAIIGSLLLTRKKNAVPEGGDDGDQR